VDGAVDLLLGTSELEEKGADPLQGLEPLSAEAPVVVRHGSTLRRRSRTEVERRTAHLH
jgi:hypothetical protein